MDRNRTVTKIDGGRQAGAAGAPQPFHQNSENGNQHTADGAVAAAPLVCAHCNSPLGSTTTVDIMVTADEAGATRLTSASDRGHVALLSTLTDVCLLVPDGQLQQWVDSFNAEGLVCARRAEGQR